MSRHFTLDEATALLPEVGRLIREAVNSKDRLQSAEAWLHDLAQRIMMSGGVNVDTSLVESWKNQRESSESALKGALEQIEEIGVLVKDLDVGLVDFPTLYRGEEVYLCWRMDEDGIEYWHGVHEGFAGRKEIDREFIANHRGEGPS
jgi:hypothetical protein